MSSRKVYSCDTCGKDKTLSDLKGYMRHSNGDIQPDRPDLAGDHVCIQCLNGFYLLRQKLYGGEQCSDSDLGKSD